MTPTLIIFDCDGVLVDSEPIASRVLTGELQALGLTITVEDVRALFHGSGFDKVLQHILDQLGRPAPPGFEDAYRKRSTAAFERELQPIPGIQDALKHLQGKRRCVASNGPRFKIEANLALTRLAPFFQEDVFSAYDIQRWKPEPDLFLHAAQTLDTRPEHSLVIEDSVLGVQAARRAEMAVLAYAGAGNAGPLREAGGQVFEDMAALPGLIAAWERSLQ